MIQNDSRVRLNDVTYDAVTRLHGFILKNISFMEKAELNKSMHLSEHFTLGEVTKTSVKTAGENIPSHVAIENLKNLCENWLEDLRYSYNTLYPSCHLERSREISPCASLSRDDNPIIITSGYRSPEVNRAVGGSPTSNT